MSSEDMFKTPATKSEFVTRKEIVDRRLKDAGWKIARFDADKPLSRCERCEQKTNTTRSPTFRPAP